jgi:hypothetical protein
MRTLDIEEAKVLVSKTAPPVIEEVNEVVIKPKKAIKRKKTHRRRKSTLKLRKVR